MSFSESVPPLFSVEISSPGGRNRRTIEPWRHYEGRANLSEIDMGPLDLWLASETSGVEVLSALRRLRRPVRKYILERIRPKAISAHLISWLFEHGQMLLSMSFTKNPHFVEVAAPLSGPFLTEAFREAIFGKRRMGEQDSFPEGLYAYDWMVAASPALKDEDIAKWVHMATRTDKTVNREKSRSLLRQALYSLPQTTPEQLKCLWKSAYSLTEKLGGLYPEEDVKLAQHRGTSVEILCAISCTGYLNGSEEPWIAVASRPEVWGNAHLFDALLATRSIPVYLELLRKAPVSERSRVFKALLSRSPSHALQYWEENPVEWESLRPESSDVQRLLTSDSEEVRLSAIRHLTSLLGKEGERSGRSRSV